MTIGGKKVGGVYFRGLKWLEPIGLQTLGLCLLCTFIPQQLGAHLQHP